MTRSPRLALVLSEARSCRLCAEHLPHEPRPVVRASPRARVLIIGQAPGLRVHESGTPWNDASGDRLRAWLGVERVTFDGDDFAIVPMGFCYPGRGASGDLPPRPECAPTWQPRILPHLKSIRLTLLVGSYAQGHVLGNRAKASLTETVRAFRDYLPMHFPLPHPSPRNAIWQAKNRWFERDCLPVLRERIDRALGSS